jgi:phosphatidate cytidylyltransferase
MFLYGQKIISEKLLLMLSLTLLFVPVIEIFRKKVDSVQNIAFTLTGIILIAIPFSLFNLILIPHPQRPELYEPVILLGMMVIIWASDSGAYITGSLLGKHKLAERISPNKTWEGTVGGILFAITLAVVYFSFFDYFTTTQVILISIATAVSGIFGDLTESLIKRYFDVKDSGSVLPGHGGLFDRYDSLLFAAPVYFVLVVTFIK